MMNILKNIAGFIKPYKLKPIEKEFIRLNEKEWSEEYKLNSHCLVEGHITCPASIIDKARIAKAIQEQTGAEPVVFLRGFYPAANDVSKVYESFNINKFYMWWSEFLNPLVFIPALFHTFKTLLLVSNGEKLVGLKHQGVLIGDLLYDTLIRYKPNSYTITKITFGHYRLIFRAFLTFYNNKKMLNKYQPKYMVTSHNVYAEFGMLPRQLKEMNSGVVFLKDIYAYKCYDNKISINEHFLKPSMEEFEANLLSEEYVNCAQKYFSDRMSGTVDQIDVKNAFLNKKKYTITDLKEIYPNIKLDKKNVVVMSHAFSDAPHVGEGLLFKDYYDFLEKTLIQLNKNSNINCFIKAHPSSYMWNEKGAVEELIEKNSLKNIYITPHDLNTNSILDFADCIVTAKGTAGLEFSCAGIPAITAGKGYYYGFGITHEPNSIQEYYDLLAAIENIKKLDEKTVQRALVLLYMVSLSRRHSKILPKSHIMPGENYNEVYLGKYKEVVENLKNGIPMRDEFYDGIKKDVMNSYV